MFILGDEHWFRKTESIRNTIGYQVSRITNCNKGDLPNVIFMYLYLHICYRLWCLQVMARIMHSVVVFVAYSDVFMRLQVTKIPSQVPSVTPGVCLRSNIADLGNF